MQDHHGSDDPGVRRVMSDMMKKTLGEFPDGKLDASDEGAIPVAVSHVSGRVKIMYPKPVAWLAMPPEQAVELAEMLLQHAKRASGYNQELDAKIRDLSDKLKELR